MNRENCLFKVPKDEVEREAIAAERQPHTPMDPRATAILDRITKLFVREPEPIEIIGPTQAVLDKEDQDLARLIQATLDDIRSASF